MANLSPVPDTPEHFETELQAIRSSGLLGIYPYAAITLGEKGEEVVDMEALLQMGAIAFSDDGRGVQSGALMEEAMRRAKSLGAMIVAHCEDNSLLEGGYIHDGEYARLHGHRGISSASEYAQVARDLELVAKTGVKYHVCHVSTHETVSLLREAKRSGLDVTCETGPHYLVMTDRDIEEDGRFKMNPPLRSEKDREALLCGVIDGTVDMIATDHAPHSAEEKSKGLEKSAMGVVGIETAFPLLYTHLVKTGLMTLERLIELMAVNPRKRFNIPMTEDFSVWDLSKEYTIDPEDFLSKGRATPFAGWKVSGENLMTIVGGKIVWQK
jgi:dihydroorotase